MPRQFAALLLPWAMRVLIVGCGYIGMPLGAELSRAGHKVFGLRRSSFTAEEMDSTGISPLKADISKGEELAKLPSGYDWVVNCVASSGGGADAYRAVYLQGSRNLVDWLSPNPPAKFVYTSSTSVYGQTDGSWVSEDSPTEPATETSKILVETETVLLNAAREKGFPAAILRLAGIYGPDRGHYFKQFKTGEARISGNGDRLINMIHRDDVVGAIIAALNKAGPGRVYNAVDDEPVTQLDFFQWLATSLGKPLPPIVAQEQGVERKRGLTQKKVSNRRLKLELGYQFKYPTFREGYRSLAEQVSRSET